MMQDFNLCSLCDAWIDQDLPESQQVTFELHLKQCEVCRQKVQRWRNLEYDLVAALGLFGSFSAFDESQGETNFAAETLVPNRGHDLVIGEPQTLASVPGRALHRYPLWTAASILIFAAVVGWLALGKLDRMSQPTAAVSGRAKQAEEKTRVDPASHNSSPTVVVNVREPAVALAPVTNARFTVVKVYPIFERYPREQAN